MKRTILYSAIALILASCGSTKEQTATSPTDKSKKEDKVELNKTYTTESGLQYEYIKLGEGRKPQPGEKVHVHYVGKLTNGNQFDSSRDRGQPFSFVLGKGQVIAGWDEGIALLGEGDQAILTIPPTLGYGSQNLGVIPPNSTLVFEVELVKIGF